jgi:glutathione S-transferase
MPHRLITIPFSHFCEKARWSLDVAGVVYREEGHCPVLHRFAVRRAGGRHSVPLLVTEDGQVLPESALIVRFADEQAPGDRKLLPADGRDRASAIALEQRFDLELAPHIRRFVYFHLLPRRADTLRLFGVETPRVEHTAVRALFPLMRGAMKRFMRIDEPRAIESRDRTRRVFEEVGGLLADGRAYLTGDRFTSADIAFAALAAPLVLPAEHPVTGAARSGGPAIDPGTMSEALASEARALQGTPAGLFAARLYRDHRHPHLH